MARKEIKVRVSAGRATRRRSASATGRRRSTSRGGKQRRGVRGSYLTPKEAAIATAAASAEAKFARSQAVGRWAERAPRLQATALDQYVLGLYCPEVESRGPCLAPHNTFCTTHNTNFTVSNTDAAGTNWQNMYVAIGDWRAVTVGGAQSTIGFSALNNFSWETQATFGAVSNGAAMVARATTTAAIGQAGDVFTLSTFQGCVPVADDFGARANGRFGMVANWDSDTCLYSGGTAGRNNANPRRVVGLKVVVVPVSSPLNIQGSLRVGDNGTIAIGARTEAVTTTGSNGLVDAVVTNDVFDVPWPDSYSGYTGFTRDPRIKELGAIQPGAKYEAFWVPTAESQVQYEDESEGGTWTFLESRTSPVTGAISTIGAPTASFPCNVLRRGPAVVLCFNGLSTTTSQSFQIRATLCYEHTVTPYGNANLYSYSRRAPWFPLPWDRMADLPTAACGVGHGIIAAGRALEERNDSMRVGPQPSIARALLAYTGAAAPVTYSPGVVNPNGAPPIVGTGAEGVVAQHIAAATPSGGRGGWLSRAVSALGRGVTATTSAAKHAAMYGIEHANDISLLYQHVRGSSAGQLAARAGPIVEEVADATPYLAIMAA